MGLSALRDDVRFALRAALRQPRLAGVVTLVLSIGIGTALAVFTLVDHTLLRPPPFLHGERLVDVLDVRRNGGGGGNILEPTKILGWQQQPSVFERFETYMPRGFDVTADSAPQRVSGLVVSPGLFDMLGVLPGRGRGFVAEDGRPGGQPVVVVSERLVRRLGWDPDRAVGRSVVLNGNPHSVIGVMAPTFSLLNDEGLWVPMYLPSHVGDPDAAGFFGIARLAIGQTVATAQALVFDIADGLQEVHPLRRTWDLRLDRKRASAVTATTRTALLALLGAVGVLLLLTCANVALLLVVHAMDRDAELAIRSALGAGQWRLWRQSLLEIGLLVSTGGILGVLLAWSAVRLLVASAPPGLRSLGTAPVELDVRIVLVAGVLTAGTAAICGWLPARLGLTARWRVGAQDLARRAVTDRRGRWTMALVAVQLAASLTLITGTTVSARAMARIAARPLGFDPSHVITMRLDLPTARYPSPALQQGFMDDVVEALRRVSGVIDVAVARRFVGAGFSGGVPEVEGRHPGEEPLLFSINTVSPDYFRALRIPLLAGRTFRATDADEGNVVINQGLAHRLWPGGEALGKRFREDRGDRGGWKTVIGIVGDVDVRIASDRVLPFQIYEAWPRHSGATAPSGRPQRGVTHTLIVRASRPVEVVPIVRQLVASQDTQQPVDEVRLAIDIVTGVFVREHFVQRLLAALGAIGLLLAALGIYGALSHNVRRRTREFGIRITVGATPARILALVARGLVPAAAVGLVGGLVGAQALARSLGSLLHGVPPGDPASLAAAVGALIAVALAAAWGPARRAASTDPAETLRADG